MYLVKTDATGNEQWSRTFGGWEYEGAYSVQETLDGGFILAGRTRSFGAGSYDMYLVKTDALGRSPTNPPGTIMVDVLPDAGSWTLEEPAPSGL